MAAWQLCHCHLSPVSVEGDGCGHQMAAVSHRGASRAWLSLSREGTAQPASASVSASLLLFYVALSAETLHLQMRILPVKCPVGCNRLVNAVPPVWPPPAERCWLLEFYPLGLAWDTQGSMWERAEPQRQHPLSTL